MMNALKPICSNKDNTGIDNWNGLYNPLMNVNHFIQKVETECPFLSEENRKGYLAPAYGLRALYYFMLYQNLWWSTLSYYCGTVERKSIGR